MILSTKAYHIFISYQQETVSEAETLFKKLSIDFNVFFDKKSLSPGDNWIKEIEEAQLNSQATIILVSADNMSPYPQSEIINAIKLNRTNKHIIIPILITGTLPSILTPFQSIDLQTKKIISVAPQIKKVLISKGVFGHNYVDYDTKEIKQDPQLREQIDKKLSFLNTFSDQNIEIQLNPDKERAVNELKDKIINKYAEENRECYVAHLDLDKFSNINKKYGDAIGDMLMIDIVNLLTDLTSGHYFKKVGKDEFIIFIEQSKVSTLDILNNIRETVSKTKWELSHSIFMSVSIGFAKIFFPPKITDFLFIADDALKRAVLASRTSKSHGGNEVTQGPLLLEYYLRNLKWTDFDS